MRLKTWTPLEMIEATLAINVLIWGIVFLFPENVFDTSRYKYNAIYAQDWLWGTFLVVVGVLLLTTPKTRWFTLRRWLHVLCWVFWFSMTLLIAIRTFADGVSPTDFLFLSVFTTIALCHLTLYNRLVGVK